MGIVICYANMSDDFLFYLTPHAMAGADLNTLTGRINDRFGANKHGQHVIRFFKNTSINFFGHYILRFELFISELALPLSQKCGSREALASTQKSLITDLGMT